MHNSNSSLSETDGTLSLTLGDLDIPIAHQKHPCSTAGKLPSNLSSYDICNYVLYASLGS
jgi:hypothetical protein